MIKLVEHFYSIQGEGIFAGTPSIFLRFGGCNLNCSGFNVKYKINGEEFLGCDTFYAVDKRFSENWQKIQSVEELKKIIASYQTYGKKIKNIVITGGEPLIHIKNDIFIQLLDFLHQENYRITIETNGTIKIPNKPTFQNIIYSISLKLSNSGENTFERFNLEAISSLIKIGSKESFFKFTIDKKFLEKGGGFEIVKMVRNFPDIKKVCMPIGNTEQILKENSEAVVKFCLDMGYIYSDRLHIRIWDNLTGV